MNPFQLQTNKKLIFGAGERRKLVPLIDSYPPGGVALFTGKSIALSEEGKDLIETVKKARPAVHITLSGEPSPAMVDEAVEQCRKEKIVLVIAMGGGSVIDAGKAAAAMLCETGSVKDYLEGVGTKEPSGKTLPLIAMPTTSGTGSEATKNAVISDRGEGYKKSLRHDNYVPEVALVDPELTLSCPRAVTVACGLDSFSQLLESYFSTKSSVLTDTLAFEGMGRLVKSFLPVCEDGGSDVDGRSDLAYASYLSGVTLANAGLGTVHGIAGPLGGLYDIPHGVACGLLLKPVMEMTLKKIAVKWQTERWEGKVTRVATLLAGRPVQTYQRAVESILGSLEKWLAQLEIKPLGFYGIEEKDLGKIILRSDNKNNPYHLTAEEMETVLLSVL
ncbi:MAG: iron-containing alcohol dehydrogenase [Spirochaetales bacterium]|nr:iron-containing alcohol dehydrogenase [Spirochaetales bacterium]